jgi:galactokinase
MAFTEEQQAQLDIQIATEDNRAVNQAAADAKRAKLEALRIAKEVLVENRRTKTAAEAVDIDNADVTNFAAALTAFVNS